MDFIPQMEPYFDDKEINAINAYMQSGGWLTEHKVTRAFEDEIKKYTGAKYCFAVNNGTISLSVALLALGIKPGDEIIVPDLTMIATPNSAHLIGAKPVFVDIDSDTLCMDYEAMQKAVTEETKAIIYVSFNGRAKNVEQFRCFCAENKLGFIEDAAQSLGSYYNGKHLGRFGDIGSFSFSVPKIITMGQGGALITDNDLLAEKIGYLKDFGRKGGGNDIHHCIGYNFKLTDLQAVIGCEQMKKLPQRLIRKKEIYSRYVENLKDITEVCFINTELSQTSPWFIDLYVPNPDELAEYLKLYNIGTRRIYPPIHKQQAYKHLNHLNFSVTEKYCSMGLWLPSSIKLSDIQIDYICDNIIHYYGV